jgi:exodeoxyribonuclease VII large subunit
MEIRALSVSEVNGYIKRCLGTDPILSGITVQGEISNYTLHSSGHLYFSLKDSSSRLRCIMFRDSARKLSFAPSEGMKVMAKGSISVYERDGQYQLYIREMSQDGLGELYQAFEQLKKTLEQKGYFDDNKKKALPFLPGRIGIVTSAKGAAVRDIITTINRRFGRAEILVYNSLVQGDNAPRQLCQGIEYFNSEEHVDVIIIGRGGGSIEELWAFNDEELAKAVFASEIPVVSAVGHQTDFTIADFVSDRRAPTPTAAGELVVPDVQQVNRKLSETIYRMEAAIERHIRLNAVKLKSIKESYGFRQPLDRIVQFKQQLDEDQERIRRALGVYRNNRRMDLEQKAAKLDSLSPISVLQRGYAVVREARSGRAIKSVLQVEKDNNLDLLLRDGTIDVRVSKVKRGQRF